MATAQPSGATTQVPFLMSGWALPARQAYHHFVTKPIDRIVRTERPDWLDRKARPLRKLRSEQTTNERYADIHLVCVHFRHFVSMQNQYKFSENC
jgi:hypothetical protein